MATTHELQEERGGGLPQQASEARKQRLKQLFSIERLARIAPHLPVVALMVGYTFYCSRLSVDIHRGYGTPAYDMGIFDQGIWLLSRFKAPFVTIMGRNLFGDHTSFILLLLVPLYWVYPHAAALLVVQSFVLALGVLPVYLIARRRLESTILATILAGAFLLHPALQWGNLEQFHPECFLVPLIGFALYAAIEWRPWLLVVTAGLALLVKEDAALLIVPLGIWIAIRREQGFGLGLVAAAAMSAMLTTEVVIRAFVGMPTLYSNRIPFGGPGGFVRMVLRKPGDVLNYLTGDGRPQYLWQMSFPSALVFLRAPGIAAIGLGVLGANVISNFPYQHQITTHYSLPLVPVIAIGTVVAIGQLKMNRQRVAAVAVIAVCSLWACFLWGVLPAFSIHKFPHRNPSSAEVHNINAVLAALPKDAVVSAFSDYVPHIDHRDRVYLFPTPFRAAYWGTWKQEGQRLAFSNQVRYLLLPTRMSQDQQAVFAQISGEYQTVKQIGDVVLFERRPQVGP
jgi:uncharacterized membrane protein